MKVELLFFEGCPNAGPARALVRNSLARLGADVAIDELEGDFPSPTILVNGSDVMGGPLVRGRSCRLDLPTEEKVLEALARAMRNDG